MVVREDHQRAGGDRDQDREAAEPGRRLVVEAALARLVDRPDAPRQRAEDGGGEQGDYEREPEALYAVADARHARSSV